MLTPSDIRALNRARTILGDVSEAATRGTWTSENAGDLGRLSQACESAEWSVFTVLNIARAYCNVEISDDVIHNRVPERSGV